MRSGNPALGQNTFLDIGSGRVVSGSDQAMSINGTVNKTGILLLLIMISAMYTWSLYTGPESMSAITPLLLIGGIGGFIVALVTIFKKQWAPVTAPFYALLEGLLLGGLSAMMEARFPGIVIQAVGLTFGTLGALLMAYRSGLIRATENFKLGVVAATGGIFVMYLVTWVLGMFGVNTSFLYGNGLLSIGISLFVVVIAALNLVLDFDMIEQGAKLGAPKYLEWYAGFSLLVTLVWLYIEILRLLAKLNSRRN
jgi:uncharacterized YccA/Bax inhibitor family protein